MNGNSVRAKSLAVRWLALALLFAVATVSGAYVAGRWTLEYIIGFVCLVMGIVPITAYLRRARAGLPGAAVLAGLLAGGAYQLALYLAV